MKIAVFHDVVDQANLICRVLSTAKYSCHVFVDTDGFVTKLAVDPVDLLLLHWPSLNGQGREILQSIRNTISATIPILFIADASKEHDVFEGITAGTDDYLLTPLRSGELLTRIRTLLTLHYPAQVSSDHVIFDPYVFDPGIRRITANGEPIPVTAKEFALAMLLMCNLGRPLSRTIILEEVWGGKGSLESRSMDTHVSRVRNKLGLGPKNGFRLTPIYSYGYQLERINSR